MVMTNEEICRNYRQAKSPREQIQILADLNQCKKEEIIHILKENGVIEERLRAESAICRDYLAAKNRTYYIQKAAKENHCSVEEIRQILIGSGVLIPRAKKTISGSAATEETVVKGVSTDWKTSLKAVMERITELKQIRDTAEKELSEIYQTLDTLCEKE